MMQPDEQVVIVTGASRGIGAAIARLAGTRGYKVVVNFSKDRDGADRIVAGIERDGGRAMTFKADVSREDDVLSLFAAAQGFGTLTGLVNNSGIAGGISRVEDVTYDALQRVFAVNAIGSILCAREAVRRMSTRRGGAGGVIVNISSISATLGGTGELVHYAATKGAINTLTIGLSREAAADGIRVNAVMPGLIETGMHEDNGAPDRLDRLVSTVPMQRTGTSDEVATLVLWLMSDEASYVTGAIIPVTGGR